MLRILNHFVNHRWSKPCFNLEIFGKCFYYCVENSIFFLLKVTVVNNFSHRYNTDSVVTSWLLHMSNYSPVFFFAVVTYSIVMSISIKSTCEMKLNRKNWTKYSLPVIIILLLIDTPCNPLMGSVGRSPTCLQELEPTIRTSVVTILLIEPNPPNIPDNE